MPSLRRQNKKTKTLRSQGEVVVLNTYFNSLENISNYIKETGLAEIFRNKEVTNLVDYVFGIEVGMDSNARKNRGGDNMSNAVSLIFQTAEIYFKPEVSSATFPEIISLGVDVKRFDFVIKTKEKTYLIEVNYYNSGGSKLNEVARAYADVAPKINQYDRYEFVWITDGQGWFSAKNKLEEAFNIIPKLYNLTTIDTFVEQVKSEGVLEF